MLRLFFFSSVRMNASALWFAAITNCAAFDGQLKRECAVISWFIYICICALCCCTFFSSSFNKCGLKLFHRAVCSVHQCIFFFVDLRHWPTNLSYSYLYLWFIYVCILRFILNMYTKSFIVFFVCSYLFNRRESVNLTATHLIYRGSFACFPQWMQINCFFANWSGKHCHPNRLLIDISVDVRATFISAIHLHFPQFVWHKTWFAANTKHRWRTFNNNNNNDERNTMMIHTKISFT